MLPAGINLRGFFSYGSYSDVFNAHTPLGSAFSRSGTKFELRIACSH